MSGKPVLTDSIIKKQTERMDDPTLVGILPGNHGGKPQDEKKLELHLDLFRQGDTMAEGIIPLNEIPKEQRGGGSKNSLHLGRSSAVNAEYSTIFPSTHFPSRHKQPQPGMNLIGVPQRARVLR